MNRLVKNCKKCLRNKPVNEVVLWNWNDEDYRRSEVSDRGLPAPYTPEGLYSIDNFFLACDDCCEELCNLYMMRSDKKVDITEIHQSSQEGLETIPFDWIERKEGEQRDF